MAKDYLAMRQQEPDDAKQHGILGMKWGRRRSDSQIKADIAKQKAAGEKVTPTAKAASVTPGASTSGKPTTGAESTQARYSRLQAQAKAGKASEMDDADLKFFNARTEALSKVAKMNEQKPGWLAETSKKVLQQTAQQSMQAVATGLANKYINDRITAGLKTAAEKK